MGVFTLKNAGRTLTLGLVSDTHGAVDECIAQLMSDCDFAVHAGDVGDWSVVQRLQPRKAPPIVVRGNNDTPARWPTAQANRLAGLPEIAELDLPGGRLVVVHGHRHGAVRERHARLRAAYPRARVIVYGHSHRLVCDDADSPWVLNPGAAGRQRTYGGPSCLVLAIAGDRWSVTSHRFAGKRA